MFTERVHLKLIWICWNCDSSIVLFISQAALFLIILQRFIVACFVLVYQRNFCIVYFHIFKFGTRRILCSGIYFKFFIFNCVLFEFFSNLLWVQYLYLFVQTFVYFPKLSKNQLFSTSKSYRKFVCFWSRCLWMQARILQVSLDSDFVFLSRTERNERQSGLKVVLILTEILSVISDYQPNEDSLDEVFNEEIMQSTKHKLSAKILQTHARERTKHTRTP